MFKNYFKIAIRNLIKYKTYSTINILGLAIGMASCILILLFVQDEISYDKYHDKADRIYRVTREWFNSDGASSLHLGHVAPPIAPLIKNDFPDIKHAVRITDGNNPIIIYKDNQFQEPRFYFADPDIFKVFTLPFLQGEASSALMNPGGVVISESMAKKYFGDEEAMGNVITFDIPGEVRTDLKVTGIMKDMPSNSHVHMDFIGSMLALEMAFGDREFQSWGSNNYATYLLFPENYNVDSFVQEIPAFIGRHHPDGEEAIPRTTLHLQKITDIHLHSHLDSELEANGNIIYVYILAAIAFFLLLIACVNFMNLATARSANRSKEVGLRKVVGAERSQLVKQFLGETIVMSVFALILAIVFVLIALPDFGNFVGKEVSFNLISNPGLILSLVVITFFVGIVAGSYPSLFLSRFQPAAVFKSDKAGSHKSLFRTVLVVFQFAISIILIVSMGIVQNQVDYCLNKDLGLDTEQVVVLPAGDPIIERYPAIETQLLQKPNIISVAASKRVPSGRLLDSSSARVYRNDEEHQLDFRIANVRVSHSFVDTYKMKMVAGRNFSVEFPTDSTEAFIINETAVKKIGWQSPEEAVDQPFRYGRRTGRIVGVVQDFHYESLHQPITPIVFWIRANNFNSIAVRIRADQSDEVTATINYLRGKWAEFQPNSPFTYSFLDERYAQLYQAEHKLEKIFGSFSMLAVFIACLGLFGLASYTAEQRTKEIGIRKVLGATIGGVVFLLSKEFTKLVLVATLVAWPIAYYAMGKWLGAFAYRIDINLQFGTFILAAVVAFVIALATVSFQAIKAALTNPVNALHYE